MCIFHTEKVAWDKPLCFKKKMQHVHNVLHYGKIGFLFFFRGARPPELQLLAAPET